MANQYDVIIVGGGIVGMTLAVILAKTSFRIALIEATPITSKVAASDRAIVLADSSRRIFESLKIWPCLSSFACPIAEIHVSDQGRFGTSRLLAKNENLPALGYVLPANQIATTMHQLLREYPTIHLYQPARFRNLETKTSGITVEIEYNHKIEKLSGSLLVAADGQMSCVRRFLNIDTTTYDYEQAALLCNVDLKRSHCFIAYERFTPDGPLALLPLLEQRAAVVWTVSHQQADHLLRLPPPVFEQELQRSAGYRLGKLSVSSTPTRSDLKLITATKQIAPGIVLLGNAVHTLHPVAGQGLNLALRDVATLAEEIHLARKNKQPLANPTTLENYLNRRRQEQEKIINLTHSLVGIFSNSLFPIVLARNTGMLLLDRIYPIKQLLTRRALGLVGKAPRLLCGMELN